MAYKTSPNTNLYLLTEEAEELNPAAPEVQPLRWVSSSLEGSYETVENDTKLPGRNPSENFRGTDSNSGDLVVNFAPLEYDQLLEAVLCSEDGFVRNTNLSDQNYDVFELVPGNKQRIFSLLKEYSQDPKMYQIFKGLQFNTLGISFTIGALVKLTFGLMGANNPKLEDVAPFDLANKLDTFETKEFFTLEGCWKFKGPNDPAPVEYIDGVDITLEINNGMESLNGLFQREAIEKSLGMLTITGNINEYVKDGKLYNLAKDGEGGELHIKVIDQKDDVEYEFILKISFENSSLSGDPQLQQALPFATFGENRFMIRKKVRAGTIPIVNVSSVYLDTQILDLETGDTHQLTATVEPQNATNPAVTWESDDVNVATVQDGLVEAIGVGSATITVRTVDGNYQDNCTVDVSEGD